MSETLSITPFQAAPVPRPSSDYYSFVKAEIEYIGMISEPTPPHVFSDSMDPATFDALDTISDREMLDDGSEKYHPPLPEDELELRAQSLANLAIEAVLRAHRIGDNSYELKDFLTGVEAEVKARAEQKLAELPSNWLEIAG
jgi:hypothetical protein